MALTQLEPTHRAPKGPDGSSEAQYERWRHWPVNWSAIAVGSLSALALSMVFVLAAVAVGANEITPEHRIVDMRKVGFAVMAFSVLGSFFAFAVGGWVAGKIAGVLHSEPAMLHGAIVWLTAIPILSLFSAVGAGGYAGSWYTGLSSPRFAGDSVPFQRPDPLTPSATEQQRAEYDADWAKYRRDIAAWNADTPRAIRSGALCAVSALFIGLIGSVLGGWMASGEPMSLRYRRESAHI